MVGAHKIDDTTDDLIRLRKLFDLGLTNTEIARMYRTNKGETISRTHIMHIREGKKWNPDKRTFLMKKELEDKKNLREVQFFLVTDNKEKEGISLIECPIEKAVNFNKQNKIDFELNKDGSIDIFIWI